ncbi:ECF transporter S component [Tumebacillus algifaecis]|nr:ECF transporter S component [Tumebacillus algifaecis]
MKRKLLSVLLILVTVGLAWLAYALWPSEDLNWAVTSFVFLLLALGLFYLRFERAKVSSKEMALIASLAALAVVGRIIFAPFPNFKPTSYLILLAGYVFGPRAGFMVGATVAVISNMFFGQGPWTPWQMMAWGLIGATAGLYGRWRGEKVHPLELAVFGAVWGFLFGWFMNTWVWLTTFYPLNLTTFLAANAASVWFDVSHATANVLFALLLTRSFLPILYRFRKKLTTTSLEVQTDVETKN